ncbi:LysM and putative peptidoglycan-binding domain-containing protein 2 [Senna tora]|uniref:LysM and putative peptidoglycan-binding domain-containing protein 2 n=1 Tax=Senna tora TaxID=362788 RepID=A0A834T429_9FABA|nr:LysM and putative peptidoglycan-binding domain-containing protein 2 [Senna tora]
MSPSNYLQNGGGGGGHGRNWIEHEVSKLDTLAGVAIKYGVEAQKDSHQSEVTDIKRMNGLATDLQMFALKTLRIPLPGRHPPSDSPPNGAAKSRDNSFERRPSHIVQSSAMEPFQSLRMKAPRPKNSSAMNTLQTYYGLKSSNPTGTSEGTEMAVYRSPSLDQLRDDHETRNFNYDLLTGNGAGYQYVPLADIGDGGGDKSDEKSVRRRQKVEVDSGASTPERLLKEENSGGSSGFSSAGKSFAMRLKSASRAVLFPETESGWLDSIPMSFGESIITDVLSGVRKSLSASSLKDQDKSNSAAIWPLQAFSTAAIANPIFNGLPITITGRRSKAALD